MLAVCRQGQPSGAKTQEVEPKEGLQGIASDSNHWRKMQAKLPPQAHPHGLLRKGRMNQLQREKTSLFKLPVQLQGIAISPQMQRVGIDAELSFATKVNQGDSLDALFAFRWVKLPLALSLTFSTYLILCYHGLLVRRQLILLQDYCE